MYSYKKSILILLSVLIIVFGVFAFSGFALAQDADDVEARKAELEVELAELELEIAEKQALLDSQKVKSSSLQRDINILTTQINKAKLEIKARDRIIAKLGKEIGQKGKVIIDLSGKIKRERESLAQLIRKTNEIDNLSIVHMILSTKSLSNFYIDVDSLASLKASIKDSVDEIRIIKGITQQEKNELQRKEDEEVDAKREIERQKKIVESSKKEQNKLLGVSKNKEGEYQKIVEEREKKAAEIRSALFALRDTAAIPFGQALDYANWASKKTGVRPAFILAILKQESNMGENIGSCYLRDTKTGDGVGKNTGRIIKKIMKPTRDVSPFLRITKALGLDWRNTPVSCPWTIGYGGAMGPSQFIASTWEMFESKIAAAVGLSRNPNPWDPKHAITATAIYMDELGADGGTFNDEREAACRYYSGRSCYDPKVKNMFYGNAVMAIARDIQENMIDPLTNL